MAADVEQKKPKMTVFVHTFHVRAFSGWWGLPSPFLSQIFGGLLTSFIAIGVLWWYGADDTVLVPRFLGFDDTFHVTEFQGFADTFHVPVFFGWWDLPTPALTPRFNYNKTNQQQGSCFGQLGSPVWLGW